MSPIHFALRGASRQSHILRALASPCATSIQSCSPKLQTCQRNVHLSQSRQSEAVSHSHGKLWLVERTVAGSLLGILPAAYFIQHPAMEFLLTASLVLHSHWGIQGIFGDYMHGYPGVDGERRYPWLAKLGQILAYVLSITAFACLLSFNYNDVGLQKAISMLWKV